jgi:hypothetical protein
MRPEFGSAILPQNELKGQKINESWRFTSQKALGQTPKRLSDVAVSVKSSVGIFAGPTQKEQSTGSRENGAS